jgi:hypothetical protein
MMLLGPGLGYAKHPAFVIQELLEDNTRITLLIAHNHERLVAAELPSSSQSLPYSKSRNLYKQ